MRIQHNIAALNSYRQLNGNNSAVAKNLEKLSSGYKINRAGDDAAGLAISEKMRAQITGLETAQSNAQDGISLIQTAEGNLQEVHSMLNRMVELATQSANGTYDNDVDRANLQKEVSSLSSEIDRIAESANFNGIKLLNGDLGKTELNSYGKTDGVENLADGITVDAPIDGAGKNDEYSLDFKGAFGAGDTITYKASFKNAAGDQVTKDITLTYKDGATAANGEFEGTTKKEQMKSMVAALKEQKVGGSGTDAGSNIFAGYDITLKEYDVTDTNGNIVKDEHGNAVKDYKINLKAGTEGVSNVQLSTASNSTAVVDKAVIAKSEVTTNGANAGTAAGARAASGFDDLVNTNADFQLGDVLTFKANVQGKAMTVTLKVGTEQDNDNGVFKIGSNVKETTENLVNALKNSSFKDETATGINESQYKVSDYFTINANTKSDGTPSTIGSIEIKNVIGDGFKADTNSLGNDGAGKGLVIKREGIADKEIDATKGADGTAATGADAVKQKSTLTFTNTFMDGDSVTIRGNLSDGLSFETTLTAGKDFAIGDDSDATMANIVAALKGGASVDGENTTVKLQVAQSDGSVKDVESSLIFGAGGDFAATAVGGNSGQITLESTVAGVAGKGVAGSISSASTSVDNKNKVTNATVAQDVVGKSQSNAVNTLTFDPSKIEQGTKITIDGKTYEFVNDDGTDNDYRTNTDNVAIKVANLNKRDADGKLAADAATGEDLAQAVINTLHNGIQKDNAGNPTVDSDGNTIPTRPGIPTGSNAYQGEYTAADGKVYNLSVDPNSSSLKMVSKDTGTDAVALKDIAISSQNQNTTVVKFNTETTGAGSAKKTTANVKVGDTITVDGKTYEFTDGEHRTKTEGNVEVQLNVKDGYTAEDAAKALADAINTNTKADVADGKPGGVVASVGTVENKDGSRSFTVNLTSKYDDTKGEGHEYDAPTVEIPVAGKGLTLQVGETSEDFQKVNVAIDKMDAKSLGIGDINAGTQEGAAAAIDKIKAAINTVSATRGDLGAIQNRLEHTINNLGVTTENMTAAESRIRDTDMAKEMMEFTKNNILVQASQAMLAQANQLPQGVLQLLQ